MDEMIDQRRNIKKPLVIIALIVLFLIVVVVFFKNFNKSEFYEIQSGVMEKSISGNGILRPLNQQKIYAPFEATVVKIHRREGEDVDSGDVIISLANEDVTAKLLEAELVVSKEQYNYEEKKALGSQRIIELELRKIKVEADLKRQSLEFDAFSHLKVADVISKLEYSRKHAEIESLQLELQQLKILLKKEEAQSAIFNAAVKSLLEKQKENLEAIKSAAQLLEVRSNIPGKVDSIFENLEVGSIVKKGQDLVIVADYLKWIVDLDVPAAGAELIRQGDKVNVNIQEKSFEGRVDRIYPSAKNQLVKISVNVIGLDESFRVGLRVFGKITTQNPEKIMFVENAPSYLVDGYQDVLISDERQNEIVIKARVLKIDDNKVMLDGNFSSFTKIRFINPSRTL